MADAPITERPHVAVTYLGAPVRQNNSHVMNATWKITDYAVNPNYGGRATALQIAWTVGLSTTKLTRTSITNNERINGSSINLNSFTIGSTTYQRSSFYPLNANRKLNYVTVSVKQKNDKGLGPAAYSTRKFTKPKKPTIDDFSFDGEYGIVTTVIRTDAGAEYAERYDTRYIVSIENTRTGSSYNYRDTSSTSTAINVEFDAGDYQELSYSQYIKVTVKAWARGYAGDSEKVSKTYYVSYPAQALIRGIDISEKTSAGKCTLKISPNSTESHPVDRVRLDYLADSEYSDANSIPAVAAWVESNITDNNKCTALSIPVGTIMPDAGHYTWLRVTSLHADVLSRYSEYKRVKALETKAPTASDDKIKVLSAVAGEDGKSAIVLLGWNANGLDDSTGTELTWSDEEDTWISTESPSMYTFTWSDGSVTKGSTTYQDSATIVIKGLEEGTKYYIRARRYLEADVTTYSDYSEPTETVITSEKPESIVASADDYIPTGSPLTVTWTFSGNSLQKEWQIVQSNGTIIASGEGSTGSTQVSADRLESLAVNDQIAFTVQASTGSGFVISESHTVSIIDPPTLSVTSSATLTAQPYSFTATSSQLCDLIVIVKSQGATSQMPQGIAMQTNGDTVHSDVYSPIWTESNDEYTATVELPPDIDFWDMTNYELSVVAVDRTTGLKSEEVVTDIAIDWTNKAIDPLGFVALTVIDTTDTDGIHRQAVQLALTPPTGSQSTDVYDVYRMDVETPRLIGRGLPLTYTVADEYAPFGKDLTLKYRIATRTIDGSVTFADIEYQAPAEHMRFDWATGYLELKYGINFGDSYSKDVDIRNHMDGSSDAYWNMNVARKSTLSSSVIKIIQPKDIEKARTLARYNGPVFVRLPDGSAFEADVQVTDLSKKNEAVTAIAIDATEIGLTQEFLLPNPTEIDEEEDE